MASSFGSTNPFSNEEESLVSVLVSCSNDRNGALSCGGGSSGSSFAAILCADFFLPCALGRALQTNGHVNNVLFQPTSSSSSLLLLLLLLLLLSRVLVVSALFIHDSWCHVVSGGRFVCHTLKIHHETDCWQEENAKSFRSARGVVLDHPATTTGRKHGPLLVLQSILSGESLVFENKPHWHLNLQRRCNFPMMPTIKCLPKVNAGAVSILETDPN